MSGRRPLLRSVSGLLAEIGETPLVRLSAVLPAGFPSNVQVWAKLEAFNPSGSVKARAAMNIVHTAEQDGRLFPGMTLLDASSGNTAIAYAMIAASRGYRLMLCVPENANMERKQILAAYGAELIYTSPLEGSDGAILKARQLSKENPEWFYCDQYANEANWKAHFSGTGPEIWSQTNNAVTHFVSSLGTTGTFVGCTRFLEPKGVACYSVEPDAPFHGLEGMKYLETSIVPEIYDSAIGAGKLEAPTEESYELVRKLARAEGILAGPSSAAALWGAISIGKNLEKGLVVTVFPDGGERYLSEPHIWREE